MTDSGMTVLQIILAVLIPAMIAGVPALLGALTAKKESESLLPATNGEKIANAASAMSDATEKVSNAYNQIVDDLQGRIARQEERQGRQDARQLQLEAKVEAQGRRIRHLERGVRQLVDQVRSMGGKPVFELESDGQDVDEMQDTEME